MLKRAAFVLCLATPASAQGIPDTIASAELLDGWMADDGRYMTALQITLAPGWKTYWRSPGDAGIPPQFDWAASENAARIALSYPLPTAFELAGMRSIGYYDEVIFPIAVTPDSNRAPVTLSGDMIIGVCEEVCVPLELSVSATLTPGDNAPNSDVLAAMANQPMGATRAGVGAVSCRADFIEDGLRVVASIEMPPLGREEVAVIEYADRSIWVSEPKVIRNGDQLEAHADLVPMASGPFAFIREDARITIFGGGKAVEINGCG